MRPRCARTDALQMRTGCALDAPWMRLKINLLIFSFITPDLVQILFSDPFLIISTENLRSNQLLIANSILLFFPDFGKFRTHYLTISPLTYKTYHKTTRLIYHAVTLEGSDFASHYKPDHDLS